MDNLSISQWILENWGIAISVQLKAIYSIIAFVIIIILRKLTVGFLLQRKDDVKDLFLVQEKIELDEEQIAFILQAMLVKPE